MIHTCTTKVFICLQEKETTSDISHVCEEFIANTSTTGKTFVMLSLVFCSIQVNVPHYTAWDHLVRICEAS